MGYSAAMSRQRVTRQTAGQYNMVLSAGGLAMLDAFREETGKSRAELIVPLLVRPRKIAPPNRDRVWYPGKHYPPMAIRLGAVAGTRLEALVKRHGHGRGEIVECLMRQHLAALLGLVPVASDRNVGYAPFGIANLKVRGKIGMFSAP